MNLRATSGITQVGCMQKNLRSVRTGQKMAENGNNRKTPKKKKTGEAEDKHQHSLHTMPPLLFARVARSKVGET